MTTCFPLPLTATSTTAIATATAVAWDNRGVILLLLLLVLFPRRRCCLVRYCENALNGRSNSNAMPVREKDKNKITTRARRAEGRARGKEGKYDCSCTELSFHPEHQLVDAHNLHQARSLTRTKSLLHVLVNIVLLVRDALDDEGKCRLIFRNWGLDMPSERRSDSLTYRKSPILYTCRETKERKNNQNNEPVQTNNDKRTRAQTKGKRSLFAFQWTGHDEEH